MINKKSIFVLAFMLLYISSYAQKNGKDIFDELKLKASVIAENNSKNITLKKLCITTGRASVIFTEQNDSVNIFSTSRFSRRAEWEVDTLSFSGTVNRILPNNNLETYKILFRNGRYQYIMFGGRDTLFCSILKDNAIMWSNQKLLSRYRIGKIGGVTYDNTQNTIYAFFMGNHASLLGEPYNNKKNVVMSISSNDNGETWSDPTYVVKHNEIYFDNISIAEFNRNRHTGNELYMLLSRNDNSIPYYSKSVNGGISWSYPKKMTDELYGYDHKIMMEKEHVYILYKKNTSEDKPSDMYIWLGDTKNVEKGERGKVVTKITDNANLNNLSRQEIDNIDSSSSVDLTGIKRKKLCLMASAKWNPSKPVYIIGLLVDIKTINID